MWGTSTPSRYGQSAKSFSLMMLFVLSSGCRPLVDHSTISQWDLKSPNLSTCSWKLMLLSPWFISLFGFSFHSYLVSSSVFPNKIWLHYPNLEIHEMFVWLCLPSQTSLAPIGWIESCHCSLMTTFEETSVLLTNGFFGCFGSVLTALSLWLMWRMLGWFWLHTLQIKCSSQSLLMLMCTMRRQPKQIPVSFRKLVLSLCGFSANLGNCSSVWPRKQHIQNLMLFADEPLCHWTWSGLWILQM